MVLKNGYELGDRKRNFCSFILNLNYAQEKKVGQLCHVMSRYPRHVFEAVI